jgi:hypothetical protein
MNVAPLYKTNTIVLCPCCDDEIAIVAFDIYPYEQLDERSLGGLQRPIKNGMETKCIECGEYWFGGGKFLKIKLPPLLS